MQTKEAFWIVMEFAEGGTLASKVDNKDFSESDAHRWALQLTKVRTPESLLTCSAGNPHPHLKPELINPKPKTPNLKP